MAFKLVLQTSPNQALVIIQKMQFALGSRDNLAIYRVVPAGACPRLRPRNVEIYSLFLNKINFLYNDKTEPTAG